MPILKFLVAVALLVIVCIVYFTFTIPALAAYAGVNYWPAFWTFTAYQLAVFGVYHLATDGVEK